MLRMTLDGLSSMTLSKAQKALALSYDRQPLGYRRP